MPLYRPSDLHHSSDRCDTDAAPDDRLCHPARSMVGRRTLWWRRRWRCREPCLRGRRYRVRILPTTASASSTIWAAVPLATWSRSRLFCRNAHSWSAVDFGLWSPSASTFVPASPS